MDFLNSPVLPSIAAILAILGVVWGIIQWWGREDSTSLLRGIHTDVKSIAAHFAQSQLSHSTREIKPEEVRRAAADIAGAITELLRRADKEAVAAVKALNKGDATAAKELFDVTLKKSSMQDSEAAVKEKAQATRHLAAFTRLENVAEAAVLYRKAATLDPSNPQNWIDFADLSIVSGELSTARNALETAITVAKTGRDKAALTAAMMRLGDVLRDEGKVERAMQYYTEAADIAQKPPFYETPPTGAPVLSELFGRRASLLLTQDKLKPALEWAQAALDSAQSAANSHSTNQRYQGELASAYELLAEVQANVDVFGRGRYTSNFEEAQSNFQSALQIRERLIDMNSDDPEWAHKLIWLYLRIADAKIAAFKEWSEDPYRDDDPDDAPADRDANENLKSALLCATEAVQSAKKLSDSDQTNVLWKHNLAMSHHKIGIVLSAQSKYNESIKEFRIAQGIMQELVAKSVTNHRWKRQLNALDAEVSTAVLNANEA